MYLLTLNNAKNADDDYFRGPRSQWFFNLFADRFTRATLNATSVPSLNVKTILLAVGFDIQYTNPMTKQV